MSHTDVPLKTEEENAKAPTSEPLAQVRAAQAWQSALRWWAQSYPGQPVDMGVLLRRTRMSSTTAYRYLHKARTSGLVTQENIPALNRLAPGFSSAPDL